ncbi:MAG: divergent PAP2 family protein [Candidatus Caldatribacteriota bacterium]
MINNTNLQKIFENQILWIALITFLFNQILKLIIFYFSEKRWNLQRFIGMGGMPSTHSALAICVTSVIGLSEGWDSALFALSLIISFIIMADAAGVRRETGEQAKVLNKILLEFFEEHKIRDKRFKELIGHTPFEVIVGALIGLVLGVFLFYCWNS